MDGVRGGGGGGGGGGKMFMAIPQPPLISLNTYTH